MKAIGVVSSTALLLMAFAVPMHARQGSQENTQKQEQPSKPAKQQQVKPNKQQQRSQQQAKGQQDQQRQQVKGQQGQQQKQQQQQAKGQQEQQQQHAQEQDQARQHQQRARGQGQDQNKQQQKHKQEANRRSQQAQRVQTREHRAVWKEHRARDWQSERRDWRQRGGYHGYRIPETHYRGHFGPDRWFRISMYPLEVYGGYPRFRYGGFWFGLMDPWPEYWSDSWYDDDDVYIVYSEEGYYLHNRRYPRDRIAITVYVN